MKICLLCYRGNPYSGGQGIYLKYIADEMVRQGHEVHAISGPPYPFPMEGVTLHKIENNEYFVKKKRSIINPEKPLDIFNPINFYEWFNSRFGAFPEISSFSYRAYWLLRKLHKEHDFDIIHDNQSVGYGLLLMKTLGIPVVSTIHHPLSIDLENVLERVDTFKRKMKTVVFYPLLMQSIVGKRLSHIITVSEDSRRTINRDFGIPLKKQTVVYNGIDRNIFKPLKIKREKNTILFVGNIEDGKKGFVYLLRAMTLLKNKEVRLRVVDGGAPHRKITQKLIDVLGIRHMIDFAGTASMDELVRHYNEAAICAVPSVYEGFGFPAGEAMACETPVISSDGGALPEVVGNSGIIVPARDEIALAKAMDDLIGDEKKRKELGKAGLNRMIEKFNWDVAVKEMIDVFEKSISQYKQN